MAGINDRSLRPGISRCQTGMPMGGHFRQLPRTNDVVDSNRTAMPGRRLASYS